MSIRKQTRKWKQKDGTKIRICDMSDLHLINTIDLLHRYAKAYKDCRLKSLHELELMFHSELALEDIENEIEFILDTEDKEYIPADGMYETLVLELERRDLEPFIETWVL